MTEIEGYNIAFKVNGKTFVGRTQDDLTIAARTKESITKDDAGVTRESVVGHDVTFSVQGICGIASTGETNRISRDEILAMSLLKGSEAIVPVTYGPSTGAVYGGNAIITNMTESSGSEDSATYGLDFKITGNFTLQGSGS